MKAVAKSGTANGAAITNDKATGIGPLGIKGEYMVSDRIGVGVDFSYANSTYSYNATPSSATTYDYKFTVPRITGLARVNFHFGNSDKVDWYGGVGVGYKNTNFKITSNDPDLTELKNAIANRIKIPVGYRLAFGTHIFFTDNIGINIETGLGGPLVLAGLSLKL